MPDISQIASAAIGAASTASGAGPMVRSGGGESFGAVVKDLIHEVNESQGNADNLVQSLALGEPVEIHQVMMALSEASNALNLTLQVRNKALEAYQEVMRLQI